MNDIEQVKDVRGIYAMRRELERMRSHSALVNNVFTAGIVSGMTIEETYVMLAYHAVRQQQRLMQQLIDQINITPPIICVPMVPIQ